MTNTLKKLPLDGIRVIEFSHMVMGPSCGLILADLGADVVKIEPVGPGDKTRRLPGSGAGYFAAFNRNKRSLAIDMKSDEGRAIIRDLTRSADVVIENFREGALDRMDLGARSLRAENPRLIYCSMKGFLSGAYEGRAALDEIVQMMGGLAYMTGPPGRPLRAGASVNDIGGGMFAVIAILSALMQRQVTGVGSEVRSGLFENNVFLVSPSMLQSSVLGQEAPPMPVRLASWAVYDVFATRDERQFFLGVVTDSQWQAFCSHFGLDDLGADATLRTNLERVNSRERVIPRLQTLFQGLTLDEAVSACEAAGLPVARIAKPHELYQDPHMQHPGSLLALHLPETGQEVRTPSLPMEMDGQRLGVRRDLPGAGEHTREVLTQIGLNAAEIDRLAESGIVSWPQGEIR